MKPDWRKLLLLDHKPELADVFDSREFEQLRISEQDDDDKMTLAQLIDRGYINNLVNAFQRILFSYNLLKGNEKDGQYCDFLHDCFLNQALSITDAVASFANHFLGLGLRANQLALHNQDFQNKLLTEISDFENFKLVRSQLAWVKHSLFPYRNLVHHHGIMAKTYSVDEGYWVLNEDQVDMTELRESMRGFPDQVSMWVATGQAKKFNTDFEEFGRMFTPIDHFFYTRIGRLSELNSDILEAVIWKQNQAGFIVESKIPLDDLNRVVFSKDE